MTIWSGLMSMALFVLGAAVLIAPWFLGKACPACGENTWDYDSWPQRRVCTRCGLLEDLRK